MCPWRTFSITFTYDLRRGIGDKDIEVARTVRWTETATTDLEEVVEFIARDSRFYAAALVREARAGANSLRTFADRGRVVLYGQEYADPALMRIRLNIVMCL
jgi:plasmid stabilization system protein ParE